MTFDPDPNKVIPTVIAGAVNALKAAFAEPSVKRFVYTSSSTAALLPKPNVPGIVVTENTWNDEAVKLAWSFTAYSAEQANLTYAASKTQAEQEVWKFYNENKHKRPDLVVNTGEPDATKGRVPPLKNKSAPRLQLWQESRRC
jgi:nucleoside-diphosphate-sugar epimerase